ncbi:MAG: hypothetical protein GY834_04965 [Bacteroidetes bacterium]|nr:hypothetical protein [Bacteroidota bacterium]
MNSVKKYRENRKTRSFFILLILGLLTLGACHKEHIIIDGAPGRAYLALTWTEIEPDYIDPGTFAIPDLFYWDEYYRITPGFYTMYYDGAYYDQGDYIEYAWEVDYEIWINYGESGTTLYDGRDGADTYFVVECNPYDPYVYLDLKSTQLNKEYTVLEEKEDLIIIQIVKGNYSIKLTYRKVEKRKIIKQEVQQ